MDFFSLSYFLFILSSIDTNLIPRAIIVFSKRDSIKIDQDWCSALICFCQQCQETCPKGKYGENCSKNCTCPGGNYECSALDGSCTCEEGWSGSLCTVRECPEHLYGDECKKNCECITENTERYFSNIFVMELTPWFL